MKYFFDVSAPHFINYKKTNTTYSQPKQLREILKNLLRDLAPNSFNWEYVANKIQYALNDNYIVAREAVPFAQAERSGNLYLAGPDLNFAVYSSGTDGEVRQSGATTIASNASPESYIFADVLVFIQKVVDIILYNPRLKEITQQLAQLSLTPESHSDIETSSNTASGQSKVLYSPVNVPASRLNDSSENTAQGTSTRTIEKWDGQLTKDALIAARDNINDAVGDIIEEIKTLLVPGQLIHDTIEWGCQSMDDWWIDGLDEVEDM